MPIETFNHIKWRYYKYALTGTGSDHKLAIQYLDIPKDRNAKNCLMLLREILRNFRARARTRANIFESKLVMDTQRNARWLRNCLLSTFFRTAQKKKWKLVFSFDFVSPYRSHSSSLAPLDTYIFLFLPLSSSLPRVSFLFFCKREWDKLVNLYANGFNLRTDRGVMMLSAVRLNGGSRGDRGESPKISRSRIAAVYRPAKYHLYAIAVHWAAHRALSNLFNCL